jgi:ring-1,2-phenylacetyl-CoA epoxidase subunit PaaD
MVTAAWAVAAAVTDPELPMLTLADLGVLRDVTEADGAVSVSVTPTYSGCPALEAMRDDLIRALQRAGFGPVEVHTVLRPPWTTDWITAEGHRKLADAGIAPPGPAPRRAAGPVPLTLGPPPGHVQCPRCGSPDTVLLSPFGATACRALRRCRACQEPFEHVKEL